MGWHSDMPKKKLECMKMPALDRGGELELASSLFLLLLLQHTATAKAGSRLQAGVVKRSLLALAIYLASGFLFLALAFCRIQKAKQTTN
jgi:hypothetical protein